MAMRFLFLILLALSLRAQPACPSNLYTIQPQPTGSVQKAVTLVCFDPATLRGPQGVPGPQGAPGPKGDKGDPGLGGGPASFGVTCANPTSNTNSILKAPLNDGTGRCLDVVMVAPGQSASNVVTPQAFLAALAPPVVPCANPANRPDGTPNYAYLVAVVIDRDKCQAVSLIPPGQSTPDTLARILPMYNVDDEHNLMKGVAIAQLQRFLRPDGSIAIRPDGFTTGWFRIGPQISLP